MEGCPRDQLQPSRLLKISPVMDNSGRVRHAQCPSARFSPSDLLPDPPLGHAGCRPTFRGDTVCVRTRSPRPCKHVAELGTRRYPLRKARGVCTWKSRQAGSSSVRVHRPSALVATASRRRRALSRLRIWRNESSLIRISVLTGINDTQRRMHAFVLSLCTIRNASE